MKRSVDSRITKSFDNQIESLRGLVEKGFERGLISKWQDRYYLNQEQYDFAEEVVTQSTS